MYLLKRSRLASLLALTVALAATPALTAQGAGEVVEIQDFDTPEAWALKYFASVSSFHALRPVGTAEEGFSLSVDLLHVPHLDTEQRTVGFGGQKEENLNRAPIWPRFRGAYAFSNGIEIEAGWVPPVEVDGIKANMIGLAVQGPLAGNERWNLGWRLFAQNGEADADFTCTAEDASFAPGSAQNPFGCEAESADTVTLDHYGGELVASWVLGRSGGTRLFVSGAFQQNDLEFQVNAQTFGFNDRTRIVTDGTTTSFSTGIEWNIREGLGASVGVRYTPLDIVRPGQTKTSDDLIHLRALVTLRR